MAAVNIKLNPVGIAVVGVVTIAIVVYTTGFPFNTFGSGSDSVDLRELLSVSVDLAQVRNSAKLDHKSRMCVCVCGACVTFADYGFKIRCPMT